MKKNHFNNLSNFLSVLYLKNNKLISFLKPTNQFVIVIILLVYFFILFKGENCFAQNEEYKFPNYPDKYLGLDENEIKLFSKSGRFAMIYGKDIDVQSVENFFNNKVNIIETTKLIRDFWPLAEEEKFMERAGDYTVLFDRGVDIVKTDIESLSENPLITDFLVEMRKLKANHGAPTENELKAFFASHTNSRQ